MSEDKKYSAKEAALAVLKKCHGMLLQKAESDHVWETTKHKGHTLTHIGAKGMSRGVKITGPHVNEHYTQDESMSEHPFEGAKTLIDQSIADHKRMKKAEGHGEEIAHEEKDETPKDGVQDNNPDAEHAEGNEPSLGEKVNKLVEEHLEEHGHKVEAHKEEKEENLKGHLKLAKFMGRMEQKRESLKKSDPSDTFYGSKRVFGWGEHEDAPTGPTKYVNRNRSSDFDHGQKRGPQGYGKYQEQARNQKGVHTPVSGLTGFPGRKGSSEAGKMATETWNGEPHRELRDHGKELHRKKLEEIKKMPKPTLPKSEKIERSLEKARIDEGKTVNEKQQARAHRSFSRDIGVHKPHDKSTPGISTRGVNARLAAQKPKGSPNEKFHKDAAKHADAYVREDQKRIQPHLTKDEDGGDDKKYAKTSHERKLHELKAMPKPTLPKSEMAKGEEGPKPTSPHVPVTKTGGDNFGGERFTVQHMDGTHKHFHANEGEHEYVRKQAETYRKANLPKKAKK